MNSNSFEQSCTVSQNFVLFTCVCVCEVILLNVSKAGQFNRKCLEDSHNTCDIIFSLDMWKLEYEVHSTGS